MRSKELVIGNLTSCNSAVMTRPTDIRYANAISKTRKLNYRKDDRAMRPIYGCPANFLESLTMPTATFPENFNV